MKQKTIRKILQNISILATVFGTITPIYLASATKQKVFTENDKAIFDINNFNNIEKNLKRENPEYIKFNLSNEEKSLWGVIKGDLAFETNGFDDDGYGHRCVRLLGNPSPDIVTEIENPQIRPFVTGSDGNVYALSEIVDSAFSTAKNVLIKTNPDKPNVLRFPYLVNLFPKNMFFGQNFSVQKLFITTEHLDTFFINDPVSAYHHDFISDKQVQEIYFNNLSVNKVVAYGDKAKNAGIIQPDEASILKKIHLNGIDNNTACPDIFKSSSKVTDLSISNGSFGQEVLTDSRSANIEVDADKVAAHQTVFTGRPVKGGTPKVNDINFEIPPDLLLHYQGEDTDIKSSAEFRGWVDYEFGDYETMADIEVEFFRKDTGEPLQGLRLDAAGSDIPPAPDKAEGNWWQASIQATGTSDFSRLPVGDYDLRMIVTSKFDPSVSKTFDFKGKVSRANPVESVSIPGSASGKAGTTTKLNATVLPADADQSVEWTSNDPAIATVDTNGNVEFVKQGTTKIRATSVEDNSKFAECNVSVEYASPTGITAKEDALIGKVGGSAQFTEVKVLPETAEQGVEYSSDNTNIATVDAKGNVNYISKGTTKIWLKAAADTNVKKSVDVDVGFADATSVKISQTQMNILKGRTQVLTATVEPLTASQEIIWSSNDNSIATVDANGSVTAIENGTVTITATSKASPSLKAECTVNVNEINPDSISLNKNKVSGKAGETAKITSTILPADADQSVNWKSSDESVATVDKNGNVTFVANGNAVITATSQVNENISAQCDVTVGGDLPIGAIVGGTIGAIAGVGVISGGVIVAQKKGIKLPIRRKK